MSEAFLPFRRWLYPLTPLFGAATQLRRLAYARAWLRTEKLPGITISVGNIVLGGAGKSPVVMALAEKLLQQGERPAILTRGYRSGLPKDGCVLLRDGKIAAATVQTSDFHADEALMQSAHLPDVAVLVGQKRYAAAQWYLQNLQGALPPTHWLLDDGFQHLSVARHIDLVLLPADLLIAGTLLPAGDYREDADALQRATDLAIVQRAGAGAAQFSLEDLQRSYPNKRCHIFTIRPRQPFCVNGSSKIPDALAMVCALARPEQFQRTCQQFGITVKEQLIENDHAVFPRSALEKLASRHPAIITTEKDFYRQKEDFLRLAKPVFVLPLEVEGIEHFMNAVLGPIS